MLSRDHHLPPALTEPELSGVHCIHVGKNKITFTKNKTRENNNARMCMTKSIYTCYQ